jgi:hypothetical protein
MLADAIPRLRYAFIEGASHFTYLEDPERFVAVVGDFLMEEARQGQSEVIETRPRTLSAAGANAILR